MKSESNILELRVFNPKTEKTKKFRVVKYHLPLNVELADGRTYSLVTRKQIGGKRTLKNDDNVTEAMCRINKLATDTRLKEDAKSPTGGLLGTISTSKKDKPIFPGRLCFIPNNIRAEIYGSIKDNSTQGISGYGWEFAGYYSTIDGAARGLLKSIMHMQGSKKGVVKLEEILELQLRLEKMLIEAVSNQTKLTFHDMSEVKVKKKDDIKLVDKTESAAPAKKKKKKKKENLLGN